ncbi:MAG: DUF6622 family protein [Burkholderiaceae bacterium]
MATFLVDVATHTPTWVWIALAVLVALGVRSMRPNDLSVQRLRLVPVVMGAYSLLGTCNAFQQVGPGAAAGAWAAGAVLGFAANRVLDLPRGVSANADGTVRVAGSVAPLVLFLAIFLMRYALGVTLAVEPALRAQLGFALGASLACGLPAGLLAARSRKALAVHRAAVALAAA